MAIDKAAERNASSPYLNLNFKAPFVPLDSEFFYEVEAVSYTNLKLPTIELLYISL